MQDESLYPSNSNRERVPPTEARAQKIISGNAVERKKSVGKRIAETFTGDDASTVGSYMLFDILLPAAKDMIFDAFTGGLERALGVNSSRRPRSSSGGRQYNTSYEKFYDGSGKKKDTRPDISNRARASHDFREIVLDTRGEAEEILEGLADLIETYEFATVADLYGMAGFSHEHVDLKWGWRSVAKGSVVRLRGGGYLLDLPKTVPFE